MGIARLLGMMLVTLYLPLATPAHPESNRSKEQPFKQSAGSEAARAGFDGEQISTSGLQVQFLANEGMVISGGGRQVSIDFPYRVEAGWCQAPQESQIQALLQSKPPFERIDMFLFTHDHIDHYDPELAQQALIAHPESALIGTVKVLARIREQGKGRLNNPMFLAEAGYSIQFRAVRIDVLKAPHARYWDIDTATGEKKIYDDGYVHAAYRVELGNHAFIHGGDAHFITFPDRMKTDLLILDRGVLMALGLEGLKALHHRLGASRTLLMHISPNQLETIPKQLVGQEDWLSALTNPGEKRTTAY